MPEKKTRTVFRRAAAILSLAIIICLFLTSCFTDGNGETTNIFLVLLVKPFATVLRWIYSVVNSFGWSIVLFTLAIRFLLLPLNIKGKRGTYETQRVQPKLKELEAKYKNDKAKYQEEMTKLYKSEGINPLGGCLPSLLTIPIMFALYWPIQQPLKYMFNLTSAQITALSEQLVLIGAKVNGALVSASSSQMTLVQAMYDNFDAVRHISPNLFPMNLMFLGANLGAVPNFRVFDMLFILPIISAGTALLQSWLMTWLQEKATGTKNTQQSGMMLWMMPIISIWVGFTLPAGLTVYWIVGNIIGALQELFITNYLQKKKEKAPVSASVSSNDKNNRRKRKNNR